jgi:hypothetical protein
MKLNEAPDDKLIGAYVAIRDEIAKMEADYKTTVAGPKGRMEKIEIEMLRRFQERGAESIRTKLGTAYRSTKTSVTCADWDSFFHGFVLKNSAWEMLEHRPAKTAVLQYKGEHGELPPGLNYREEASVGFRRS